MKNGDRVKVVNPNSSFCGEIGTVIEVDVLSIVVRLDSRDDELCFYEYEVSLYEG